MLRIVPDQGRGKTMNVSPCSTMEQLPIFDMPKYELPKRAKSCPSTMDGLHDGGGASLPHIICGSTSNPLPIYDGKMLVPCKVDARPPTALSVLTAYLSDLAMTAYQHATQVKRLPDVLRSPGNCEQRSPMKFIGHRGASHVLPETTMAAVNHALDQGLSFECDLQVLRTSEVVLLHDDTLERTAAKWSSDATGFEEAQYTELVTASASTLSWDELQRVDVGSWFGTAHSEERVPLFSQALQALKETGGDACCFAELKSVCKTGTGPMPEVDRQLIDAAEVVVAGETGLRAEQLTWISSSRAVACEVKRRMPEHKSLLIKHAYTPEAAWQAARDCVEYGLDGVDLEADLAIVTEELVAWLHERGKLVAVWVFRAPATNDTPEHWAAMRAAGVDYFTSNLPAELEGSNEGCRVA